MVDSIEPPPYDTVCVVAQFPESDGLPRGVALFGANRGEDWEVALTTDQAAGHYSRRSSGRATRP